MKKPWRIKFNKKIASKKLLLLLSCVSLPLVTSKTISSSFKNSNENHNTNKAIKPDPSPNVENTNTEVLLSAVGDCTIGTDSKFGYANSLPAMAQQSSKGFAYYFKNVHSILSKDRCYNCQSRNNFYKF